MRMFFYGNESAKFEQNDTTVYGLAFKGKFNMKKVSDSMEVGKNKQWEIFGYMLCW